MNEYRRFIPENDFKPKKGEIYEKIGTLRSVNGVKYSKCDDGIDIIGRFSQITEPLGRGTISIGYEEFEKFWTGGKIEFIGPFEYRKLTDPEEILKYKDVNEKKINEKRVFKTENLELADPEDLYELLFHCAKELARLEEIRLYTSAGHPEYYRNILKTIIA